VPHVRSQPWSDWAKIKAITGLYSFLEVLGMNLFLNFFFFQNLESSFSSISFLFNFFYCFYIYSYVYTLFGPPFPSILCLPASRQNLFCPLVLQFCWRENIRDNKKDIAFFLVWDKGSYIERFLVLLPCTWVHYNPQWFMSTRHLHYFLVTFPV
jgi:hypothetical protein